MPWTPDDFTTILEAIRGDIAGRLPGADARTRRSPLDVLARVLAYVHHTVYGWLAWVLRQVFWFSVEAQWLDRLAAIWDVTRTPATFAAGQVTVTNAGASDAVIAAESVLRRGDGVTLLVDMDTIVPASGSIAVPVVAAVEGAASNTAAGTLLSFVSPIGGVSSTATVAAPGLTGGADQESDDSLRERWRDAIANPPAGGSRADYVRWAREVPGVTRAWTFPQENGPGTIVTRFAMDDVYAGTGGIAGEGDRLAVLAYIESKRPATAAAYVGLPVAVPRNYAIAISPDTPAIRAAITAELADLIRRDGEPGGTLYLIREQEAISAATGEFRHVLTAPAADLVLANTQLPVLGTITWGTL